MKRTKILLVSLLTLIMSVFCFTGCFTEGKYIAKEYKMEVFGATVTKTIEAEEGEESYVQLKGEEAVLYINVNGTVIESTGTWAKDEENKNTVIITTENAEYTAVIDGKTMTLDLGVMQLILEK